MKLTNKIQEAIVAYLTEENITAKNLAEYLNTSQASVGRWINGQVHNIKHIHWIKLEPLIHKHLKPQLKLEDLSTEDIQVLASSFKQIDDNDKIEIFNFIIEKLLK